MRFRGGGGKAAWAAAILVGVACAARAQGDAGEASSSDASVRRLPASALLNVERLRLPAGEHLALMGTGYLGELAPGWWLGPMVYGAASGHRGGLFTWGAEAQRRWRLGEAWGLVAGLYLGGGGGAAAPVGGGLMLRPHADLMWDLGGWQAGLSASQVRFPSGQISSSQLGLQLMFDDRFAFSPPGHGGKVVAFSGRGGLGADRMMPTVGLYSGRTDAGGRLGYVGLRLEQQATAVLAGTLEAAGAASGGADGYMEALAGVSARWPLAGGLKLGLRGAAGLAGGGAVKTGGGPIAKGGLTARWDFAPGWSVDLEAGRATAFNGPFSARYVAASLGVALEDSPGIEQRVLHDMAWSFGLLHYTRAARKDGSVRAMDLVGLAFERSLGPHLYLTGQAHSAITGGAGAYSVGVVGLGARMRLGSSGTPWSAGAEALAGAAGGGGVASQGGAIAQPMAWIARDLGTHGRVRLAAGEIRSRRGELSTPVAELSWALAFGTP